MMKLLRMIIPLLLLLLTSCASSDLQRSGAYTIDTKYHDLTTTHISENNPVDAYQNSNQVARGAIVGGIAGGVTGLATSGLGILPGAAGGAFVGSVLGAYVNNQTNLMDQLENRGVKTVVLGDQILIVMSSDRIFHAFSPNIRLQAYSTLDMVAQFINKFTSMSVKVSAFTNKSLPCAIAQAVTQQQANAVMKYLWGRVNTRLLTAQGYGGTHLVESNALVWGDNYRIEITLEKLPV